MAIGREWARPGPRCFDNGDFCHQNKASNFLGNGRGAAQAVVHGAFRERGFTYIGLMILIAVMGVVLAAGGEVWHTAQQREREQELLFIGDQFRRAIDSYYENTPGQGRRYPLSLEELLQDPRYPGKQRYLRKIYADPITGSTEWGLIKGPDGEIFGVYSLSDGRPVKKSNFDLADRNFEGKAKYSEWVFMHVPGQSSTRLPRKH